MSNPDTLIRLENNLVNKFCYIPRIVSSMDVKLSFGSLLINSNLNSDMFNIVCLMKDIEPKAIYEMMVYFKSKNLPAAWWVGFESAPKNISTLLEQKGLIYQEAELAMAADISDMPDFDNKNLTIRAVDSNIILNDFIRVLSGIVSEQKTAIEGYFKAPSPVLISDISRLKLLVGYYQDEPVCTSSVFLSDGVAGIFDVITLPEVRGMGFGKAMTLAAANIGKSHGYSIATLTATNDAKYLYEKLGFRSLNEMFVYELK